MPAGLQTRELNTIEITKNTVFICVRSPTEYGNRAGRPHTTSIYGPCKWVLER